MSRYVGQCNIVRSKSASNEAKWHAMIACEQAVSVKTFLAHVDISALLDEGETAEEWIADQIAQDPSTGFFRSRWGTEPAWFISTAGFEFIFVE
jgi:ketol-acid reductoisomerase